MFTFLLTTYKYMKEKLKLKCKKSKMSILHPITLWSYGKKFSLETPATFCFLNKIKFNTVLHTVEDPET